jgi:hypothetical protein
MDGIIQLYDENTNLALIWLDDKKYAQCTSMLNDLRLAKVREDPTKGFLFRAILTDSTKWKTSVLYDKPRPESYIGFNPYTCNEFGIVPIEVCAITNK